ncbi:TetR/AcrR family transcriptional regulator [Actinoplanes couchii]|uniref:Transcriptional regulator, TetR n=1 Tax=Actinoplanes couchii TaxID=403638 RepID=A0ABQ3XHY2_9ACTN|nr:TetR family transcriptional regulator [Actinoplanes couchii]MDR6317704.1 DNA-binding transcriptional regulator YbjK [Actinoplanes couchii]GID58088.1 putative transcriptional regulator, TetR [Actinoplanes couchii]
MPSRQELLLDAAIGILGDQGLRALTHRAVDAAAGLPAGSAANYFKTRDALLVAVVERFADRDREAWRTIAAFVRPVNPCELAEALTAYVQRALGPERTVTVARYTLFLEAAVRPELREPLATSAAAIRVWAADRLREVGTGDPERQAAAVLDYLDGLMLHQLAFPGPLDDIERNVRRLFDRDPGD